MSKYKLSPEQVEQIRKILENGNRVELIPTKDKVKIVQEIRKEVKTEK